MTPGTRIINKFRQLEATVAETPDWWTGGPLLWIVNLTRNGMHNDALPYGPMPVEKPEEWTEANAEVVQVSPKGRWT